MNRILLAVLAAALTLSACDSGSTLEANPPEATSDAVSFDPAVLARAAALDISGPESPLEAQFTAADRPLYAFASQSDFEQAADALSRLAKWGREPLDVYERYRSLDLGDFFAPGPEIALLDEHGQVIIGDDRVTLQIEDGEPVGRVADAATGTPRETFRSTLRSLDEMRADPNVSARIKEDSEDEYGVFPSAPNDRTTPGTPIDMVDRFGGVWYTWFVYSHSAYKTWTGAKRVKAETEVVADKGPVISFDAAFTATRSDFPGLNVYAAVLTEDHGCRTYSNRSSDKYVYVEIGGSRGTGQGVIESEHKQYIDSYSTIEDYGFHEFLDGENDGFEARRCTRLSS